MNDDATGSATKRAAMSDLPKKKAPRLNSMSLSPTRGRLKGRLDHEIRLHMPLPPLSANAACQLHCWAHKESNPMDKTEGANVKPSGSRAHVMRCEECGVHLCLKCWPIFHREKGSSYVFTISWGQRKVCNALGGSSIE